jgi:hypothetical protein
MNSKTMAKLQVHNAQVELLEVIEQLAGQGYENLAQCFNHPHGVLEVALYDLLQAHRELNEGEA